LNEPTIAQTVLFADLADRPLIATFDQPHASADGGAILLHAADRHVGLLAALTATVPDVRLAHAVLIVFHRFQRGSKAIDNPVPTGDVPVHHLQIALTRIGAAFKGKYILNSRARPDPSTRIEVQ